MEGKTQNRCFDYTHEAFVVYPLPSGREGVREGGREGGRDVVILNGLFTLPHSDLFERPGHCNEIAKYCANLA